MGAGLGVGLTAGGMGQFAGAGRAFGGWLGNTIKTATGFGEYNVRSNSLYEGAQVPFVKNDTDIQGTVISHREYIMDICTSPTIGEWKSQTFAINPALGTTFEWLAQIAANYEEYELQGCIFVFRSMSGDALNSTNTALGTIIMATQYNPYQPPFVNKAEMESHAYAMSGRPSEDMVHPIECDPHQGVINTFFTRNGDVPTGADQRLYDVGRFEVATTGFQAASVNIGELHITYQVALMKPRLWTALGRAAPYYHASNVGWSGLTPLGTLPMIKNSKSTMEPTIAYNLNGGFMESIITFPLASSPLVFMVEVYQTCTTGVLGLVWTIDSISEGTNVWTDYNDGVQQQPELAAASLDHHAQFFIKTRGDYFQTRLVLDTVSTTIAQAGAVHFSMIQLPNN